MKVKCLTENSGAVTIEGENYQIVDECTEEEDTSNNGPRKSVKNTDIEKQSDMSNESIEQNESEKNKNENTIIKDNENVTLENEKIETNVDSKTDNALSNNSSSNDSNVRNDTSDAENKCLQQSNIESIDFTADITLDQLDQQKDMTDEDVLHHLDEIENIVLDPTDFQIQKENESMGKNTRDQFSRMENNFIEQSNGDKVDIKVDEKITCAIKKENKQETIVTKSEKHDWYENKVIYE